MHPFYKYSLFDLLKEWQRSQQVVERYSDVNTPTTFTSTSTTDTPLPKYFGLGLGIFITLLLIHIILWIVALVLIIVHGHEMPGWAIATGIVVLFLPIPGAPIIAILLALLVRD